MFSQLHLSSCPCRRDTTVGEVECSTSFLQGAWLNFNSLRPCRTVVQGAGFCNVRDQLQHYSFSKISSVKKGHLLKNNWPRFMPCFSPYLSLCCSEELNFIMKQDTNIIASCCTVRFRIALILMSLDILYLMKI